MFLWQAAYSFEWAAFHMILVKEQMFVNMLYGKNGYDIIA